jgi:hypothetical protein
MADNGPEAASDLRILQTRSITTSHGSIEGIREMYRKAAMRLVERTVETREFFQAGSIAIDTTGADPFTIRTGTPPENARSSRPQHYFCRGRAFHPRYTPVVSSSSIQSSATAGVGISGDASVRSDSGVHSRDAS